MKFFPLDFEFNKSYNPKLNLVSCAYLLNDQTHAIFLHDLPENKKILKDLLLALPSDTILLAYSVIAEARSLLALGLNPLNFKWIDLHLEYKMLLNHCHEFMYGRQLIDGKIKTTVPPKYGYDSNDDDDEENSSKPQSGLAAATFKLLNVKIDTEEKDQVRDLILSCPSEFTEEEKERILTYNESDIRYLPKLLDEIIKHYKRLLPKSEIKNLKEGMFNRSEYAVRTAIMEEIGYPIDYEATKSFSSSVPSILFELQNEINELFPEITPFRREKYKFVWDQIKTREWIASCPYASKWPLTDGGKSGKKQLSLKKDTFMKFFNFRHDFPRDNFGAQMVRFLNLRQNLNGFLPGSKKGSFWDYVGDDHRVRPYFGIYGTQSARSAAKATGFLFLKSAWVRSLCVPPSGWAIAGIDYSSQEFLIAALLSRDSVMINAYKSGDPYLYLAKLAGQVPWDGQRKDYERIRDIFKITCLALQFGMGAASLQRELFEKLGIKYTREQAQRLIDVFNRKYRSHYLWKKKILNQYRLQKYLKLPCHWVMFGDNPNDRSVCNFPVQGFASSIMRKAVALAQDRGLKVIKTLHDAIYIEYKIQQFAEIDILAECMDEAFRFYFPEDQKKDASIRLEANTWSLEYNDSKGKTPKGLELKIQSKYFDKRGAKEYEKFKQYLEPLSLEEAGLY